MPHSTLKSGTMMMKIKFHKLFLYEIVIGFLIYRLNRRIIEFVNLLKKMCRGDFTWQAQKNHLHYVGYILYLV